MTSDELKARNAEDLKEAWEKHIKRMERKENGKTEKHTGEAGAKRPWENLLRVSMVL